MFNYFHKIRHTKPSLFGVLIALFGVLVLTPDTLAIRLSELDRWPLMGWRGILMGTILLLGWRLFFSQNPSSEWRSLRSWPGLVVIIAFSMNSVTFTIGIVETSATVVLTSVATMPVFAAILSFFMLGERQGWSGWLTIAAAMGGVGMVVLDGNNAINVPDGSVVVGAVFGVLTAIGLALTFTMVRKHRNLAIVPAAALGALISGIIGFSLSDISGIINGPLLPILIMGVVILPLSFACLAVAPRYTSSAVVSLLMLLEMVLGPFWVWVGIGERPTSTMIIGAAIVFVTLTLHILRTHWPPQN